MYKELRFRPTLRNSIHEKLQKWSMEKSRGESNEHATCTDEEVNFLSNERDKEKTDAFPKEPISFLSVIFSIIILIPVLLYYLLYYSLKQSDRSNINNVQHVIGSPVNKQEYLPSSSRITNKLTKQKVAIKKSNIMIEKAEMEETPNFIQICCKKTVAPSDLSHNLVSKMSSSRIQSTMPETSSVNAFTNAFHAYNRLDRDSYSEACNRSVSELVTDDCDVSTCSLEYDYESWYYEKSMDSHNSSYNYSELSSEGQCSFSFLTDSYLDSFDSDNLSQTSELDFIDEVKTNILDSSLDDSSKSAIQRDMKSFLKIFYP